MKYVLLEDKLSKDKALKTQYYSNTFKMKDVIYKTNCYPNLEKNKKISSLKIKGARFISETVE